MEFGKFADPMEIKVSSVIRIGIERAIKTGQIRIEA